jgi:DNA recombination protein RmuC
LHHQAEQTRLATDAVQLEARRLSRALTGTNVRGLWGESELRRLVEAAGMLERVNFDTQATIVGIDERRRPDMVVHLAGGRDIVVDAKVPLDALMADTGESDGFDRAVLQRHAQALRSHIDTLAGRNYADLLPDTPELVVLYLPAESLLSLALAADAGLLDHAFGKGVALATPTTMLALLRTVNHGWRQEAVAQNAREIHALGAELHKRLATMSGHFRKMGGALDSAVKAYNATVGSYETRVLPQARKFSELDLVSDAIAPVPAIENSPRALTVAELDLRDDEPLRAVGE